MKKFLFALVGLVFCVCTATAQAVELDNPDNAPYFGVRAGLDIVCPGDVKSGIMSVDIFKTGAGAYAGAVYNIPLWKNLYFEPGLMLFYNSMGLDITAANDFGQLKADASIRRFGFRVPFRVGYRFDFPSASVHVFTGPQVEIGVVGRLHMSLSQNGAHESSSDNVYDDTWLKRTNIAWQFGAALSFARNWQVEICGAVGMLDMHSDNASYHQSNVTIGLGYNF